MILEEEWEHHRYAVRDLDAIEAESTTDDTRVTSCGSGRAASAPPARRLGGSSSRLSLSRVKRRNDR